MEVDNLGWVEVVYSVEQTSLIFEYYVKTGLFKDCKNGFIDTFPNDKLPTKMTESLNCAYHSSKKVSTPVLTLK
jgi:uncharacterized protein YrrD